MNFIEIDKKVKLISMFQTIIWLIFCGNIYSQKQEFIKKLESDIYNGLYPKTTSIIVSSGDKIVYENYFEGKNKFDKHDTRSVTKSMTSLFLGNMILNGLLSNEDQLVNTVKGYDFKDKRNDELTFKDLLTMTSSLDANDSDSNSPGSEDKMHTNNNWEEWILSLPYDETYGRDSLGLGQFRYATINPTFLGIIMEDITGNLNEYLNKNIFNPMNITDYSFQYSPSSEILMGGGLKLTSRDLLKFGQVILRDGLYNKTKIVSKDWVNKMTTIYKTDEDSGSGYGYLLWNYDFPYMQNSINCWFMAGNGGNIILISKEIDTVIVITRENFNSSNMAMETIQMVSNYLIPFAKEEV